MNKQPPQSLLQEMEEVACSAAREAGKLIAECFGDSFSFSVENKSAFDYVTDVDRECEALIIDAVRKNFPSHHIVSEETLAVSLPSGTAWIVDPLDGTTNFIHGYPAVGVSIAACIDREEALGVVLDPVRNELFTARRGQGAFLNGRSIRLRKDPPLEDCLIATGFPFRSKHLLDAYLETFKSIFMQVSGIRRAGAAVLDLAHLACGRVDGFWEAGLKAWDIAAGSLLIQEAGGKVTDFWGKGNHLVNGHIVAGVPAVHEFLLQQVGKHMAPRLASDAS